jgi:hypothetical protein
LYLSEIFLKKKFVIIINSKIFTLISPGFIAGVTNRIFEDHSLWWDVLCNIDTGKITVSKDIATPSYGTKPDERPEEGTRSPSASKTESWGREKWDTTDNEFMAEVSTLSNEINKFF